MVKRKRIGKPQKRGSRFIQAIMIKKGTLRSSLQIPKNKTIPFALLTTIIKAKPGQTIRNPTDIGKQVIKVTRLLERRSILAMNLKRISARRQR